MDGVGDSCGCTYDPETDLADVELARYPTQRHREKPPALAIPIIQTRRHLDDLAFLRLAMFPAIRIQVNIRALSYGCPSSVQRRTVLKSSSLTEDIVNSL